MEKISLLLLVAKKCLLVSGIAGMLSLGDFSNLFSIKIKNSESQGKVEKNINNGCGRQLPGPERR